MGTALKSTKLAFPNPKGGLYSAPLFRGLPWRRLASMYEKHVLSTLPTPWHPRDAYSLP